MSVVYALPSSAAIGGDPLTFKSGVSQSNGMTRTSGAFLIKSPGDSTFRSVLLLAQAPAKPTLLRGGEGGGGWGTVTTYLGVLMEFIREDFTSLQGQSYEFS